MHFQLSGHFNNPGTPYPIPEQSPGNNLSPIQPRSSSSQTFYTIPLQNSGMLYGKAFSILPAGARLATVPTPFHYNEGFYRPANCTPQSPINYPNRSFAGATQQGLMSPYYINDSFKTPPLHRTNFNPTPSTASPKTPQNQIYGWPRYNPTPGTPQNPHRSGSSSRNTNENSIDRACSDIAALQLFSPTRPVTHSGGQRGNALFQSPEPSRRILIDMTDEIAHFEITLQTKITSCGSANNPLVAASCYSFAEVLLRENDTENAKVYYLKAINVYVACGENDNCNELIKCYEKLARILVNEEDVAGAKGYYEKVTGRYIYLFGENNAELVAVQHNKLGQLLSEHKDFAGAKEYFEKELKIYETNKFDRSTDAVVLCHMHLGNCYFNLNNDAKAKEHYSKAQ